MIFPPILEGRTVLTGCVLFPKIIWLFASLVDIFPPLGMQSRDALRQTARLSVNWGAFDVTYILVVVINCPGFTWASCHWLCVSKLNSQKNVLYIFIFCFFFFLTAFQLLWSIFRWNWALWSRWHQPLLTDTAGRLLHEMFYFLIIPGRLIVTEVVFNWGQEQENI